MLALGLKTHVLGTLKIYHVIMRKFFSVFLLLCLLGLAPCAHAQKWKAFKEALVPARAKVVFYTVQRKVEAAVLRAAAQRAVLAPVETKNNEILISSLSQFAPEIKRDGRPPFPLAENENEMYRGMVLDADGKDLRYILQHGLEVSKSHYENFAAYDGKEYPDGSLAIYASHKVKIAETFLYAKVGVETYLPVIFHLKKLGWRSIVSVPHDIPPSWIYRVSAILKINGRLTWGELKIRNNEFIFIPYPPAPQAGKE